jgi:hypothetical protein
MGEAMADSSWEANKKAMEDSIDTWRRDQGLPPINRAKSERTLEASRKQIKTAEEASKEKANGGK